MMTHQHADGGFYRYVGPQAGKVNDQWIEGVEYVNADGMKFWTAKDRWDERFTPVVADIHLRGGVDNVETEAGLCHYTFHIDQAGDVVHMLLAASEVAGKKRSHAVESVLRAQADMIREGLHVRENDTPDVFQNVLDFHQKFGQEYNGKPRMLPKDLHNFRCGFHDEETSEYRDEREVLESAILRKDQRDIVDSLDKQLDALCDAIWVLLGTAEQNGFNRKIFYAHWNKVVAANMAKEKAKVDGDDRSKRDAKFDIVKPAGWLPPSSRELLADHEHQGLQG